MKVNDTLRVLGLILAFISFNIPESPAQVTGNYFQIKDYWDNYYGSLPDLREGEDGDYIQYMRWREFWRNRVYGVNDSLRGDFSIYRNAVSKYLNYKKYFTRSTSVASNWILLGPKDITTQHIGLVSSVYVDTVSDKQMNTIYIGTNASGIWKTIDGGKHWLNCTDNLGFPNLGIMDITGDPQNADVIYAATGGNDLERFYSLPGYGFGILKSSDGGNSWTLVKEVNPYECTSAFRVFIDPYNSQRVYALIGGIALRSQDGGSSWDTLFNSLTQYSSSLDRKFLRDIEMKPGDTNTLYLASDDNHVNMMTAHAEIWKTNDALSQKPDWIRLDTIFYSIGDTNTTEQFELATSAADPNAVFVIATGTNYTPMVSRVWKSLDNGLTWKMMLDSVPGGVIYSKCELLVSPTDTGIIYIGGLHLYRYTHWQYDSLGIDNDNYHMDTRAAVLLKGSAPSENGAHDIIFVGNDGGLSKSVTGNATWTNLNGGGLVTTQFWGIGGARKFPHLITGGSQDNCFYKYSNNTWMHTCDGQAFGDGAETIVDSEDQEIIYEVKWNSELIGSGLIKSVNGGTEWTKLNIPDTIGGKSSIKPFVANPKDGSKLYLAGHHIASSIDRGDNWKVLFVPAYIKEYRSVSAMNVSPGDTNIIFIAYDQPIWEDDDTVRIIKRADQNNTWVNLTSNKTLRPYLNEYEITGIASAPGGADSVWITLGGFNDESLPARLLFSTDGGLTWSRYDTGLPNFPVNCIKYWNGSNGGLFVGTDVGVFFKDNNYPDWQPFNYNLPTTIVMDLEINDSLKLIRAGTFGRGLWESDLACNMDEEPLVISKDTIWRTKVTMDRSILIDSLVTLTIQDTVTFPTRAKVMVKQGGKLVVDGGLLTNSCFYNWLGIEVWGRAKKQQLLQYQGYVYLKNGATIENSRIGITTCKKDAAGEIDWNTTGGIVISDSAFFRNNFKAVEFLSYSRAPLVSQFKNTQFETSRRIIDGFYAFPSDFVSLYEVSGVRFLGCEFLFNSNDDTTFNNGNLNHGKGIYAIDATFEVDDLIPCSQQPCPDAIHSKFLNLRYGIYALKCRWTPSLRLNGTVFDSNYRSVYMGSMDYSTITRNTFIMKSDLFRDTTYGIYLDHMTGYSVQENNFLTRGKNLSTNAIGVVVNYSGAEPNEIYNNNFTDINYGIIAQDCNRSSDGLTGLVLKCNDYFNTDFDKYIAISDSNHNLDWGIALYQGDSISMQGPAGNRFSPEHMNITYNGDIQNCGTRIKYYHHRQYLNQLPRVDPNKSSGNIVRRPTSFDYNKTICCPSKLNENPPYDSKLVMEVENDSVNTISNTLTLLVDGGNTETMTSNILTSTPNEMAQIEADLFTRSPFLSDTVMQSAIFKEDVLPNEVIRDILVANPHSATSDKVMESLNSRLSPMPDSMIAEIACRKSIVSAKEVFESDMSYHMATRSKIFSDLIRYYKADQTNLDSRDSLISLLQSGHSASSTYQLALEYLCDRDTLGMYNTLRVIPTIYALNARQASLNNDYLTYCSILAKLGEKESSTITMDSSSFSRILDLSLNASEPVKSYARNIVIAKYSLNYKELILLPDNLKSREVKNGNHTRPFIKKSYLKLFPNPAKQYVITEYNLKEKWSESSNIILTIISMEGKTLVTRHMQKQQDQSLIMTGGFKSGTYICVLSVNGEIIDRLKFSVIY